MFDRPVFDSPVFARTPDPPYVAVIFSSVRTDGDRGYGEMSIRMGEMAAEQPGYLGLESARDPLGLGITVSYWATEEHARAWKLVSEHLLAQQRGGEEWYSDYLVRVAVVHRDYHGPAGRGPGAAE